MLEHKTPKVRFREAKCEEKCDGRQLLKETEFPDVGDKEAWIENMLTSRYRPEERLQGRAHQPVGCRE